MKARTSWLVGRRPRFRGAHEAGHLIVGDSAGRKAAQGARNYSSVLLWLRPVLAFRNSRDVIGFATGRLQYKCPSNGASMKGRPEA